MRNFKTFFSLQYFSTYQRVCTSWRCSCLQIFQDILSVTSFGNNISKLQIKKNEFYRIYFKHHYLIICFILACLSRYEWCGVSVASMWVHSLHLLYFFCYNCKLFMAQHYAASSGVKSFVNGTEWVAACIPSHITSQPCFLKSEIILHLLK